MFLHDMTALIESIELECFRFESVVSWTEIVGLNVESIRENQSQSFHSALNFVFVVHIVSPLKSSR